ncbi:MAG: molybdopterin-binding protein [Spirochaetaceae bacterium]|jgi:hypothetical protein|nr:molybdopterin-binding protein [Spirochaetaceae bacterium]
MKQVSVTEAVGKTLAHDLCRFAEGNSERTPFRKGRIVQEEDIPMLLSMGRDNLFVEDDDGGPLGMIHEEEAARRLAALCMNRGIRRSEPVEGKIELFSEIDGLFRIDLKRLTSLNSIPNIIIAARSSVSRVFAGDKLAGVKVVPLFIDEETLRNAEKTSLGTPLFEVLPFTLKSAGLVITGSEIAGGRIKDQFAPLLEKKLTDIGITLVKTIFTNDGVTNVLQAITEVRALNPQLVICTGGMSVDADDSTPAAIIESGAEIITYGAPVLPGSMFMLGYYDGGVPVMGVPGGALYKKNRGGIIDLVLPRIAAGVRITREDFVRMGNGGLCLGCEICHYPVCTYGRG